MAILSLHSSAQLSHNKLYITDSWEAINVKARIFHEAKPPQTQTDSKRRLWDSAVVLQAEPTHFDVKLHFGDEQFEVDAAQLPIAFT